MLFSSLALYLLILWHSFVRANTEITNFQAINEQAFALPQWVNESIGGYLTAGANEKTFSVLPAVDQADRALTNAAQALEAASFKPKDKEASKLCASTILSAATKVIDALDPIASMHPATQVSIPNLYLA